MRYQYREGRPHLVPIVRAACQGAAECCGRTDQRENRNRNVATEWHKRSSLGIPFADEIGNARISLAQRRLIRQEHDAEMLRPWLLPKSRSVDDHDVLLANEFLHENLVALGDFDFGISVKSPARRDATHARRGLAPLLREIAARAQLALHFNEMILRAFQRRP